MKKTYFIIILLLLITLFLGYRIGKYDNGPQNQEIDIDSIPGRFDE